MTREEHKGIIAFIEAAVCAVKPEQKAMDVEADAIIRALFVRNPDAAYRITRLAMAQAQALGEAKAALSDAHGSQNWVTRLLKKPAARKPGRRQGRSAPVIP